jgi:hypothetical protein
MEPEDIKAIPLKDILAWLGYHPIEQRKGEYWYLSPFRRETDPSFKISTLENLWYDFGEGEGGSVFEFIMKLERLENFWEALVRMRAMVQTGGLQPFDPASAPQGPGKKRESAITVTKVQPLKNKALMGYLYGRGIDARLARRWVEEIHYTHNATGKEYFALAFRNDSGGYEMRNPYYKGVHGRKDVTVIRREGSQSVTVFEGFMDFLSALAHFGKQQPDAHVIVLNSNAMKARAVQIIRDMGAACVYLYCDHDPSGRETTEYFQQSLTVPVKDASAIYAGYKDFNDFVKAFGQRKGLSR